MASIFHAAAIAVLIALITPTSIAQNSIFSQLDKAANDNSLFGAILDVPIKDVMPDPNEFLEATKEEESDSVLDRVEKKKRRNTLEKLLKMEADEEKRLMDQFGGDLQLDDGDLNAMLNVISADGMNEDNNDIDDDEVYDASAQMVEQEQEEEVPDLLSIVNEKLSRVPPRLSNVQTPIIMDADADKVVEDVEKVFSDLVGVGNDDDDNNNDDDDEEESTDANVPSFPRFPFNERNPGNFNPLSRFPLNRRDNEVEFEMMGGDDFQPPFPMQNENMNGGPIGGPFMPPFPLPMMDDEADQGTGLVDLGESDTPSGGRRFGRRGRQRGQSKQEILETEAPASGKRRSFWRRKNQQQEEAEESVRPRRIKSTVSKAGRGLRNTAGMTADNVRKTAEFTAESAYKTAGVLNDGLADAMYGATGVVNNIDFEPVNAAANNAAEYFVDMAKRNVPGELVSDLLTTREGNAVDTVKSVLVKSRNPEEMIPIVEDLGNNYVKVIKKVKGEMDTLFGFLFRN